MQLTCDYDFDVSSYISVDVVLLLDPYSLCIYWERK